MDNHESDKSLTMPYHQRWQASKRKDMLSYTHKHTHTLASTQKCNGITAAVKRRKKMASIGIMALGWSIVFVWWAIYVNQWRFPLHLPCPCLPDALSHEPLYYWCSCVCVLYMYIAVLMCLTQSLSSTHNNGWYILILSAVATHIFLRCFVLY